KVGLVDAKRVGQQFMQASPLCPAEAVRHDFGHQLVLGCPSPVAEPYKARARQGIEVMKDSRLVTPGRNCQDACRDLPSEQRKERKDLPLPARRPSDACLNGSALPRSNRLVGHVRRSRDSAPPAAAGIALDHTSLGKGTDDLGAPTDT